MKHLFGIVASISLVAALASCGSPAPPNAPVLSLTGSSTIMTDASTVTVSGSVALDPSATLNQIVFALNGGSTQSCTVASGTFTCAVGGLAQGNNTVVVTATDSNAATDSVTVSIDFALPTLSVTVSSPSDGATVTSPSVSVSGSVGGLASGTTLTSVAYALNGGSQQSCSLSASGFTCSVSGLGTGSNAVAVTATASDNATGTASVGVTFSPASPSVTITSPSDGATVTALPVTVSGSATLASGAALTSVLYAVDGGSQQACSVSASDFTCSVSGLASGSHAIAVTATDSYGNSGSATVGVTYNTSTGVTVTITSPADGSTVTSNPVKVAGSATVTAAATLTAVVFTLNGGNTRTCSVGGSTFTCTAGNPATGTNTFVITATDSSGATGSATVQLTYAP